MNLEKILSISGKPGLYVLKVQTRTGFVAESLLDGKKYGFFRRVSYFLQKIYKKEILYKLR